MFTYSSLLDGLFKNDKLGEAIAMFKDMKNNGVVPSLVIYNILIDGMCDAGLLGNAEKVFSGLQSMGMHPDCRTYNIMMKGVCKKGLLNQAEELFREMKKNRCLPNGFTYNTIIRGFLDSKDMASALQYIDIVKKDGFEADVDNAALLGRLMASGQLSDSSKELLQKFVDEN